MMKPTYESLLSVREGRLFVILSENAQLREILLSPGGPRFTRYVFRTHLPVGA